MCLLVYIWHFILFWDRAVKINAKIVLKNFPDKSSFWQRRWTFFDLIFFLYYLLLFFSFESFFAINGWKLRIVFVMIGIFVYCATFSEAIKVSSAHACKICSWNKTKITSVFYIMNEVLGFIIPFKWWKIT